MDRREAHGSSSTENRNAILAVARQEFGRVGYVGATLRTVARAAGVDPRLIRHYFHNKADLFWQAVNMEADVDAIRDRVLSGERSGLGARVAHEFVHFWTAHPDSVRAFVASTTSYPAAAEALRDRIVTDPLGALIAELGVDRPELRSALIGSQLIGLAMLHDVVPLSALEDIPMTRLVDSIAPELQRLLVGDLGI